MKNQLLHEVIGMTLYKRNQCDAAKVNRFSLLRVYREPNGKQKRLLKISKNPKKK